MSGWSDDLTIPLPPGRSVADLVELVLRETLAGTPEDDVNRRLATGFGLSADDAEFARDRVLGGLVRAASGNPLNCPRRDQDPVAWESFQRGTADPSLLSRVYPQFAPRQ